MIPSKTLSLLKRLQNFQLYQILISPIDWLIKLNFIFNPSINEIYIQLFDIVHLSFSKTIDDNEGCYLVYEINLTEIDDGGKNILSSLNHLFRNSDGEVFSYPSESLLHFYLEGDVCIEYVCRKCEVNESEE